MADELAQSLNVSSSRVNMSQISASRPKSTMTGRGRTTKKTVRKTSKQIKDNLYINELPPFKDPPTFDEKARGGRFAPPRTSASTAATKKTATTAMKTRKQSAVT